MKEYPILFQPDMVEAIYDEIKHQTRRLVKRVPLEWLESGFTPEFVAMPENYLSPYGYDGDDLWVRETWSYGSDSLPYIFKSGYPYNVPKGFENIPDLKEIKWKPSIHMPKIICRTFLHNRGVRIERLHDITDSDAIDEGTKMVPGVNNYCGAYKLLWERINGKESWDLNPWVWVIKFSKYERDTNS